MNKAMTLCALVALAGSATIAAGQVFQLQDRNSVLSIDTTAGSGGAFNWAVDGTNHLAAQWFWFRINGVNTRELPIDSLTRVGSFVQDTNTFTDNRPDTLGVLYSGFGLDVQPTWTLRGGTNFSGVSDVTETIVLTNRTNQVMNLSFFQYSDFDLNGTASGDSVEILAPVFNTARQTEGVVTLSETVVSPQPSGFEVGAFPSTRVRLDDANIDNLNNTPGLVGPGDVTWAFQWNFILQPGESRVISKDKGIIPTPGALALLGLGGMLAARRRR